MKFALLAFGSIVWTLPALAQVNPASTLVIECQIFAADDAAASPLAIDSTSVQGGGDGRVLAWMDFNPMGQPHLTIRRLDNLEQEVVDVSAVSNGLTFFMSSTTRSRAGCMIRQ
jgi:hypothetical protein